MTRKKSPARPPSPGAGDSGSVGAQSHRPATLPAYADFVRQKSQLAGLWVLAALSWFIRKTATPLGITAGRVEGWALSKIEERR